MPDHAQTHLTDGVAVITGATGALGQAMAQGLASLGMDLILIGRRPGRLQELARDLGERHGIRARTIAADLADSETIRDLPSAVAHAAAAPIRLVLHCAASDSQTETASAAGTAFRNVNLNAISELVGEMLPGMIEAGPGQIILISSNMAILPRARKAPYGAAKAELEALASSWRERTTGTGVRVLVVVPGLFDSDLLRAGMARYPRWLRHVLRPDRDARTIAQQILARGLGRDGLLVLRWSHRMVRAVFGTAPGS